MDTNKTETIKLVQALLREGVVLPEDLGLKAQQIDIHSPVLVREQMRAWLSGLGLDLMLGRRLDLHPCPFEREEIQYAVKNNEAILCLPKGVTREMLAAIFHLQSWAIIDNLVPRWTEKTDLWFKASMNPKPQWMNASATDSRRRFEQNGWLGFSLERYLMFVGYFLHRFGSPPDQQHWTWLLAHKYDRSGFLIAGFDSEEKLSIHGWMPNFKAKFNGARHIELAASESLRENRL